MKINVASRTVALLPVTVVVICVCVFGLCSSDWFEVGIFVFCFQRDTHVHILNTVNVSSKLNIKKRVTTEHCPKIAKKKTSTEEIYGRK